MFRRKTPSEDYNRWTLWNVELFLERLQCRGQEEAAQAAASLVGDCITSLNQARDSIEAYVEALQIADLAHRFCSHLHENVLNLCKSEGKLSEKEQIYLMKNVKLQMDFISQEYFKFRTQFKDQKKYRFQRELIEYALDEFKRFLDSAQANSDINNLASLEKDADKMVNKFSEIKTILQEAIRSDVPAKVRVPALEVGSKE